MNNRQSFKCEITPSNLIKVLVYIKRIEYFERRFPNKVEKY